MHVINDFSPATLLQLSARIERSTSEEQKIYRESELDEVWRLVDGELDSARRNLLPAAEIARIEQLKSVTMEVHDLVGVDGDIKTAATKLRAALLPAK